MIAFKVKGLRYYIAAMLMLVTMINYIDRTCLSVAAPTLKTELKITDQQYALIIMCFQIVYGTMQPIFGRFLDFIGLKRGFSLAVLWWSIANMLTAVARTTFGLSIFRGLLAVGEAANFPGVAKTASEWFPPRQRTIATGIANIGAGTGALVATPFVAWIIMHWGWQEAFVVTGAIGLIWVVFWSLLYKPPGSHPWITDSERELIQQGREELDVEQTGQKGVWATVLKQRNFWGIALTRFLSEPAWQFYSYWIPMYLVSTRGMDLKQIAMFAWMPFLAADLGSFVGGLLSPALQKMGLRVLTARKAAFTIPALMMTSAAMIAKAPTGEMAIFWFCVAAFSHQCLAATILTLPADLFPRRTVATANGLSGTFGYAGGVISMGLVGWAVTNLSYTPIFTVLAVLDIFGAIILWTMLKEPKQAQAAV